MPQSVPILTVTITAQGTISANRFVTSAAVQATAGALALGVARSGAATGGNLACDVLGTSVVEAGGAIAAGDEVQADSSGRAITTAGGVVLGLALESAASSGSMLEVLLRCAIDAKLAQVLASNDVIAVSANGALPISGISIVAGGTGLAGLTLAAPQPGCKARIRVATLTSGNVVVTTAAGVTFNGTNNTATFNAVADELVLGYKTATEWTIIENVSVTLSSV